ncbi:MAG: hypothetical protein ACKPKO_63650 [Candidatus Fonsibacter sp.]
MVVSSSKKNTNGRMLQSEHDYQYMPEETEQPQFVIYYTHVVIYRRESDTISGKSGSI